jgi:ribose-phosphate pyrophosphokinase
MKILNLVDLEKSDIKYKISKFPDGQQNISLNVYTHDIVNKLDFAKREGATIKSRLNNFQDLELIIAATQSLRNLGVKEIHLYTPYFLGSRSDRKFEEGGNNYLKDVICPVINSLGFESVTVLDPHSDVLEACINRFRKEDNFKLVKFALWNLYKEKAISPKQTISEALDCILVSPDAGASKKIYKLAEQIGYKGDIITCSKDRDADGKLTKTIVPQVDFSKDQIIIDDICDGGRTFINIAEKIIFERNQLSYPTKSKLYLIVTHGIFSKGFEELHKYFDGVYCTNSYQDLNTNDLSNLGNKYLGDFVKQLNVF